MAKSINKYAKFIKMKTKQMKKLLFILFLIPMMGFGQPDASVFYYWDQYLTDCNELVPDTMKQSGVVNVKYKPVIVNGEISHYILSPVDTVWTDCKCNKYKDEDRAWGGITDLIGGKVYVNSSASLTVRMTYTEPLQVNNKINITRNKICHIKKRKANWDDFWDRWLVEQKVIEVN